MRLVARRGFPVCRAPLLYLIAYLHSSGVNVALAFGESDKEEDELLEELRNHAFSARRYYRLVAAYCRHRAREYPCRRLGIRLCEHFDQGDRVISRLPVVQDRYRPCQGIIHFICRCQGEILICDKYQILWFAAVLEQQHTIFDHTSVRRMRKTQPLCGP